MGLLDDLLGDLAADGRQGDLEPDGQAEPPASSRPSETSATTSESVVSTFIAPATSFRAEWKQAA